jgi:hypothetical protein
VSAAEPHPHLTEIRVNNRPVSVHGPHVTGAEIKQAAINAGVQIDLDFVLSEELPNGEFRPVGDNDSVTVTKNTRFTAVAPDDNS